MYKHAWIGAICKKRVYLDPPITLQKWDAAQPSKAKLRWGFPTVPPNYHPNPKQKLIILRPKFGDLKPEGKLLRKKGCLLVPGLDHGNKGCADETGIIETERSDPVDLLSAIEL